MSRLEEYFDAEGVVDSRLLRDYRYYAVPASVERPFTEEEADRLATAFHSYGGAGGIAVAPPGMVGLRRFSVDFDRAGLIEFGLDNPGCTYLLVGGESCACAFTDSDYSTLVGVRGFVELAIGMSVEDALSDFYGYATRGGFTEAEKDYLLSIFETYSEWCSRLS